MPRGAPNPPTSLLRSRLLARYGGACTRCGSTKRLEFAHVKPTALNGRGRGSRERYYDVLKHPDCYTLLCRKHHNLMDGPNWKSRQAEQRAEEPPF